MPTTEAPPRPPPPSQLGSFDPSINFHSRTLFSLASTIHALFDLSPSVQVKKFISYQTRLISELSNRVADHKRILNRFSRTHSTSSLRTIRDSSSLLYNHSSFIYNPSYTFYDQMNGREFPPPQPYPSTSSPSVKSTTASSLSTKPSPIASPSIHKRSSGSLMTPSFEVPTSASSKSLSNSPTCSSPATRPSSTPLLTSK